MRILRLLAFALGGLVAVLALLAVVAWVILASFDAAALKAQLAQAVRDKHQRELKIEGDLALSLWPAIGVHIERASLSERNADAVFAKIDDARAELAIWPLFKKEFVIDGIIARGLSATVVRNRAGELNIADLLAGDTDSRAFKFDIARIRLENTQLGWRDEKTGTRLTLEGGDLATGRIGDDADGVFTLAGRVRGHETDAKFEARSRYHLNLARQSLMADDTTLSVSGDTPMARAVSVNFALGKLAFDGTLQKGSLEGLQLGLRGTVGADVVDAKLVAPKISLASGEARSDAMSLMIKSGSGTQSTRSLDAKINLEGARANSTALSLTRMGVDATAQITGTALRANLASPLTLEFAGPRVEVSGLSGQVDITDPKKLGKPMRVSVNSSLSADLAQSRASGHLSARLDDTSAKANWTVARFSPLALEADMELDQLNADKYMLPKTPPAKAGAPAAAEDAVPDFSVLDGIELTARAKIGSLQAARIKAYGVKLEMRQKAGVLDIAPFSAGLYQGQVAGSLHAVAATREIALKQTLSNLNLGPFLKDALNQDVMEGRGSVTMDLTSRGASLRELKQYLAGDARIELRDGAIKGINLARVLRELKAAEKPQAAAPGRAEKTDFSEISASLHFNRGIARNDDLSVKAPFLRAAGSGTINLPANTVDYLARISIVGAPTGQGGQELAQLRGLTLPLRLQGALDAPAFSLDTAEMAKQAVKSRVETLQEKGRQQLQEKLKGWLGR